MVRGLFASSVVLAAATAQDPTVNIVELAQSVPDLSTLVSAVVAGDLAETLSSPGPFTVFAPTNDAFGKLPEGTLDDLVKPENKASLVDILTYHVLPEQVLSTDLKFFQRVATVEGKNVHVYNNPYGKYKGVFVSPDGKTFNKVTAADNLATNGVAHIIDGVLLPPAELTEAPAVNIVELAESVPDLSTLVSAVVAADLADTLASPGPFTVFAPTNDAFGKLPEGTVDSLMKPENKAQLIDILTYHVLPEQVLSTDLKFFQRVPTVEGKNVHVFNNPYGKYKGVFVSPDGKTFNKVTAADNLATNGVAHIIDGVLLPPAELTEAPAVNIVELAESVPDLATLVSAVVAADLADTLASPGPFTVFAPTNDAFGKLPEGTVDSLMKPENKAQLIDILTYHVLPEQVLSKDLKFFQQVPTVEGKNVHIYNNPFGKYKGVFVTPDGKNFNKVTAADNLATNGVAHIIDGVLLPPAASVELDGSEPTVNIVELAQSVPDLSTLVTAVVAGGLTETLSSPGPFTVFAPTNDAFGKLPEGTLDDLVKPENKASLVDILTYHVLPEQVLSKDLEFFQRVATVEGKNVHIYNNPRGVFVSPDGRTFNKVTAADNLATNGVAHIIDGVLLPPSAVMV